MESVHHFGSGAQGVQRETHTERGCVFLCQALKRLQHRGRNADAVHLVVEKHRIPMADYREDARDDRHAK